jgi:DNA-binding Lrp family transcriptional regulator
MSDLTKSSGFTFNKVRGYLDKLKQEGIIRRVGVKNGGYWEIIHSHD